MKVSHRMSPLGRAMAGTIKRMGATKVRIGWFPSAKYPDGTPVAGTMAVQEFGSAKQRIPPRPFMRPTAATKHAEWAALSAGAARAVLAGSMPPDGPMQMIGMQAEADVRQAIVDVTSPPLSVLTLLARKHRKETGRKVSGGKQLGKIDRKGREAGPPDVTGVSTKPLNDTGLALATLSHEVQSK